MFKAGLTKLPYYVNPIGWPWPKCATAYLAGRAKALPAGHFSTTAELDTVIWAVNHAVVMCENLKEMMIDRGEMRKKDLMP